MVLLTASEVAAEETTTSYVPIEPFFISFSWRRGKQAGKNERGPSRRKNIESQFTSIDSSPKNIVIICHFLVILHRKGETPETSRKRTLPSGMSVMWQGVRRHYRRCFVGEFFRVHG